MLFKDSFEQKCISILLENENFVLTVKMRNEKIVKIFLQALNTKESNNFLELFVENSQIFEIHSK